MLGWSRLVACLGLVAVTRAHIIITYPGWRGNNLHTNGTEPEFNPDSIGIDANSNQDNETAFPWGMQWMYPCGGMPQSSNRTNWPVKGGALAIQPGWFPGHSRAQIHINMGIQEKGQEAPPNMSHPLMPPFELTGPTNEQYSDQFCFLQIPIPETFGLEVGDKITLQVIEHAQHGAALYNCVDVTLAEPEDVEEVTQSNCFNSTTIGFERIFTTSALDSSGASKLLSYPLTVTFGLSLAAIAALSL